MTPLESTSPDNAGNRRDTGFAAFPRQTWALLQRVHPDTWLLLALLLFVLGYRLLTLPAVNAGPDALHKWFFAKFLIHGRFGELWWNHHTTRWGVNAVTYLTQLILGAHPTVYYVPALLMSLLQTLFVFRIGQLVRGAWLGFAAATCLSVLPEMRQAGAQLFPSVFIGAYVSGSLYFLLRYGRDGWSRRHLVASALFLFAAYLTRVDALLFLPGIMAALLFIWRRYRGAVFYAAILLALFVLETVLYRSFTILGWGRLSAVLAHHFGSMDAGLLPLASFWDLFDRYGEDGGFTGAFRNLFLAWCAGTAMLALFGKRVGTDLKVISLAAVSFYFFLTFAAIGFDPVRPAVSFEARYLLAAAPLVLVALWGIVIHFLPVRFDPARARLPARAFGLVVLVLLLSKAYTERAGKFDRHPLLLLSTWKQEFGGAFDDGALIVSTERSAGVKAFRALMWDGWDDPFYDDAVPRVLNTEWKERKFFYMAHFGRHPTELLKVRRELLDEVDRSKKEVVEVNRPFYPRRITLEKIIRRRPVDRQVVKKIRNLKKRLVGGQKLNAPE